MEKTKVCSLCGKAEDRIITVRYSTNRVRLLTCRKCWNQYYKDEIRNERITLADRVKILVNREKDLANSFRKLRNLLAVLVTLILVVTCGSFLWGQMFENVTMMENGLLSALLQGFNVIAWGWIGVCTLCVAFRCIVRWLSSYIEIRNQYYDDTETSGGFGDIITEILEKFKSK